MQQNINPRLASNEHQASENSFQKAVKQVFISPLFIIFIASVYLFLSMVISSLLFEVEYISIPFNRLFDTLDAAGPWGRLALTNIIAALVVAILAMGGFAVVMINIGGNLYGTGCKVGFYLIKIPKFLQNILTLFSVALVAFKMVGDIFGMYPSQIDDPAVVYLTVAILLILLAAAYLIFFSFKSLITVSVMKEAICTATPITKQYLFTAIGYFVLADVAIGAQFFIGFNLTYTLGCVCSVLFGIVCIVFRRTMRRIDVQQ